MKNKNAFIRTIIVDDHQIFLEALRSSLDRFPYFKVLSTFTSGEKVLDFVKQNEVDVVLLDIQMPGINGLDLSKQLLEAFPQITIIILTMLDDPIVRQEAEDIGVSHFIFKGDDFDGLLSAMNQSQSGQLFVKIPEENPQILSREEYLKSAQYHLTKREIEIYALIVEGLRNDQIGNKLCVSPFTVKKHRQNIFRKMGRSTSVELISLWHEMNKKVK